MKFKKNLSVIRPLSKNHLRSEKKFPMELKHDLNQYFTSIQVAHQCQQNFIVVGGKNSTILKAPYTMLFYFILHQLHHVYFKFYDRKGTKSHSR